MSSRARLPRTKTIRGVTTGSSSLFSINASRLRTKNGCASQRNRMVAKVSNHIRPREVVTEYCQRRSCLWSHRRSPGILGVLATECRTIPQNGVLAPTGSTKRMIVDRILATRLQSALPFSPRGGSQWLRRPASPRLSSDRPNRWRCRFRPLVHYGRSGVWLLHQVASSPDYAGRCDKVDIGIWRDLGPLDAAFGAIRSGHRVVDRMV